MSIKHTLVDLVNCHNYIQDKGHDAGTLNEIEDYLYSTFAPVSQLARAIKHIDTEENHPRTRLDLVRMLEQHDLLRKNISSVSAESVSDDAEYEKTSTFYAMVESYRSFGTTINSMINKNKGDDVILDVVMASSLGTIENLGR